ncbi:MAG: hypothetical protein ABH862_02205 [Candidatus Omnitrophota bacterium]
MKKIFLMILLSCFLSPHLAFAGAWTLPQGKVRLEHTTKAIWAKEDYTVNGDLTRKDSDARTWGWSMIPKVEYGLTDWLTLFGSLEYKEAKYKEYARNPAWTPWSVKNHAVTNFDLGVKARVTPAGDPWVLSGQMKASFYTGYADGDPDGAREQPALTDRDDNLEFRALVGRIFNTPLPSYMGAETGYRFRNRGVSDDVPFFMEGGFWPLSWLLLKTEVDGFLSVNQPGEISKGYAIWRVGPVFHLLDLYCALTGEDTSASSAESYITKSRNSLDLEIQYGNMIWGENVSADQEFIVKLATQF